MHDLPLNARTHILIYPYTHIHTHRHKYSILTITNTLHTYIHIHTPTSQLLSLSNEYFKDLFAQGAPGQHEFAIDDVDYPVFEGLMRCMYSGKPESVLPEDFGVVPPPTAQGGGDDGGKMGAGAGTDVGGVGGGAGGEGGGDGGGMGDSEERTARRQLCSFLSSAMRCARRFKAPELQAYCSSELNRQLCIDVLLGSFDAALACRDDGLSRYCFDYALEHFMQLVQGEDGSQADVQMMVRTLRRYLVDVLDKLCASYT